MDTDFQDIDGVDDSFGQPSYYFGFPVINLHAPMEIQIGMFERAQGGTGYTFRIWASEAQGKRYAEIHQELLATFGI